MNVLFVCTGNTFRSASADYILKKLLKEKKDDAIKVNSAGTRGEPFGMYNETKARLAYHGINIEHHQYKIINKKMIDDADIIICMIEHHREYITKHYNKKSYLFNEMACGQTTDVPDDDESGVYYGSKGFTEFINKTVDYIYEAMPRVYKNLKSALSRKE